VKAIVATDPARMGAWFEPPSRGDDRARGNVRPRSRRSRAGLRATSVGVLEIRHETESPYEVGVCGQRFTPTSLGFTIGDLKPMSWIKGADTLVVPGLEAPWELQDAAVLDAISGAAQAGARMVSLCAGAFVLGHAGVLDGRKVTTHWALADEFRSAFPRAQLIEHAMFVDDGQVLSSGGMLASADLCLYLLGQDQGQSYANDVSRVLISPPHRAGSQAHCEAVDEANLRLSVTSAGVGRPTPHEPSHAAGGRGSRTHERADPRAPVPRRDRENLGRLDCPASS
jgi:hypothetical protein